MGASTESSTLNDGNVSLSNIDVANNENKYFKQQIKALQSEMEAMQLFIKEQLHVMKKCIIESNTNNAT